MRHIIFKENPNNKYKIAILIKDAAFKLSSLRKYYIEPLVQLGINEEDIIGLNLKYNENNKAPTKLVKSHIETLMKACVHLEVTTLLVADSEYYKKITGMAKADVYHGYVKPCVKCEQNINVVLSINYQALFYNPTLQEKLDRSLTTLVGSVGGVHKEIGQDIIHSEYYPDTIETIKKALESLHQYPKLTCDFETFSLKHFRSGIGTVAFAWNQHEGISFCVDYQTFTLPEMGMYGRYIYTPEVRALLKQFFIDYKGKLIWHGIGFDAKIAIYQLWMKHITDTEGLYEGLDIMTKNFDCTQIITYLATNSCSGNILGLKPNAQEFAGNYAEDEIEDIRKIPKDKLLTYNLVDCLSTWYVYNKNYPKMIEDAQEEAYLGIMKDSQITLIQMQLTGMPMCMDTVLSTEKDLKKISSTLLTSIMDNSLIVKATEILTLAYLTKDFDTRKDKAKNPDKIKPKLIQDIKLEFNPGSSKQVAVLLHEVMNLPIIETTNTKLPSTDEKTLKNLINHTSNKTYKELISNILDLGKVDKILSTFMPAFKDAQLGIDGIYYVFGSYKLGGTISNRLSSSDPNLQNLPSGSTYGKAIKKCFIGNAEWVFAGADFASLEDRINALLTKDTNKLKVYIDNYDGHSLRAYSYFGDQMPDIINTVESINSIGKVYPQQRQDSKAPTFALTYGGTNHTLVKNCGFTKQQAKEIETRYHDLYKESDQWVYDKLKKASMDGYVTLAFGVRLRTPILKQCIWDTPQMPYEASAEGRSAGNAVSGQSYGMLTCRAANELRVRIRNSPYKYDIKISAQIHDAIYLLIKSNAEVAEWVNTNLIECMEWQDLPEIQHDEVKLGAELDLFPTWANPVTLPNKATQQEIIRIANESTNR